MPIRFVFSVLLLISLTGCPQSIVEVHDIKPTMTTAPKTVNVEVANKEKALNVESGAFQGSMSIEKGLEVIVAEKSVNVPINIETKPGTIQAPLTINVAEKSVNAPISATFVVPEKAIVINATLSIADGAIVIKGAEAGAVQTKIEVPWWATAAAVIAIIATIFYAITKVRANDLRRQIKSRGEEKSFLDGPF